MKLVAAVGDAVGAGPADARPLFLGEPLGHQRVVVDWDNAHRQPLEKRQGGVGGEDNLGGTELRLVGGQRHLLSIARDLGDLAVLEYLDAAFKTDATQLADRLARVDECVIRLEQTRGINRAVELLLQRIARQKRAVDTEPRIIASHRLKAFRLPRGGGNIQLSAKLEPGIHLVIFEITLVLDEVLAPQPDQCLGFTWKPVERIADAVRNGGCAEAARPPARRLAARPAFEKHDAGIGPQFTRLERRPQSGKTTADDCEIARGVRRQSRACSLIRHADGPERIGACVSEGLHHFERYQPQSRVWS